MNKKIIGIMICMLLIATALPVVGMNKIVSEIIATTDTNSDLIPGTQRFIAAYVEITFNGETTGGCISMEPFGIIYAHYRSIDTGSSDVVGHVYGKSLFSSKVFDEDAVEELTVNVFFKLGDSDINQIHDPNGGTISGLAIYTKTFGPWDDFP